MTLVSPMQGLMVMDKDMVSLILLTYSLVIDYLYTNVYILVCARMRAIVDVCMHVCAYACVVRAGGYFVRVRA